MSVCDELAPFGPSVPCDEVTPTERRLQATADTREPAGPTTRALFDSPETCFTGFGLPLVTGLGDCAPVHGPAHASMAAAMASDERYMVTLLRRRSGVSDDVRFPMEVAAHVSNIIAGTSFYRAKPLLQGDTNLTNDEAIALAFERAAGVCECIGGGCPALTHRPGVNRCSAPLRALHNTSFYTVARFADATDPENIYAVCAPCAESVRRRGQRLLTTDSPAAPAAEESEANPN